MAHFHLTMYFYVTCIIRLIHSGHLPGICLSLHLFVSQSSINVLSCLNRWHNVLWNTLVLNSLEGHCSFKWPVTYIISCSLIYSAAGSFFLNLSTYGLSIVWYNIDQVCLLFSLYCSNFQPKLLPFLMLNIKWSKVLFCHIVFHLSGWDWAITAALFHFHVLSFAQITGTEYCECHMRLVKNGFPY